MPPPASRPRLSQELGDDRHELIAVDHAAFLVDDHHAIGVSVERDADIGAHFIDLANEVAGCGRAAILVDVEAVWIDADLDHVGAKLPQRLGGNLVGRAIGAIDHRPDAVEAEVLGQRALGELDIALACAVDAGRPADLLRCGEQVGHVAQHQLFNLELGVVGELVAVRPEQLDAVVGEGIVRG